MGVTFSYNLNSGDHVSTICRKFYGAFAGLRRLADVTPFAVRMRLVVVLVIPFFIYCDCLSFALLFAKKTYGGVKCLCQVCLS
jgi:hypothetical protein